MRWIWTGVFITAIVTLCFGAYIFFHQPLQYDSASCVEIRSKAGTDVNTLECLLVPGAPNSYPSALKKKRQKDTEKEGKKRFPRFCPSSSLFTNRSPLGGIICLRCEYHCVQAKKRPKRVVLLCYNKNDEDYSFD